MTIKKPDVDAVEIARKQRHLHLLGRVKNNQHLTKAELDELSELEEMAKEKKAKAKKKEPSTIAASQILKSQKEAAEYVGRNTRTIRRWVKAGMPRTEEGHYIKSMLVYYKENEGKETNKDRQRQQKAEADVKTTRAQLLELELQIKQGKLIDVEQIEKGRIARILAVKRGLLGLGRKIAKQLSAVKDPRKIQAIIDNEVRAIIENFAK